MDRGGRIARAVVAGAILAWGVGGAAPASAAPSATIAAVVLPVDDYCTHFELRYTGTDGPNNIAVGGVDGVDAPAFTLGPACWRTSGEVAVAEVNMMIVSASQNCRSGARAATCSGTYFDRATVDTGGAHDSIRIGPSQIDTTTVLAGSGDDAIRTVNGAHDVISCGDGTDVVIAEVDDDVGADCETVQLEA